MSNPNILSKPLEQQFRSLASSWKQAESASVSSSLSDLFSHPAYRQIIAIGKEAVPLLLAELEREPDWWFAALKELTGADPVPPASRGNLAEMTTAWLKWGRAEGYHW
jgi:hypothetical protein